MATGMGEATQIRMSEGKPWERGKRFLSAVLISFVSVLAVHSLSDITRWVHTWLKGDYFWWYYYTFLPILWASLVVYFLAASPEKRRNWRWWVAYGSLSGYIATVVSVLVSPIIFGDLLAKSLFNPSRSWLDLAWILLMSGLMFGWVIGGLSGLLMYFLVRRRTAGHSGDWR